MPVILYALAISLCDLFKSRRRLQAENLFLRHQLNIALRSLPRRRLRGSDRALLVWMARMCPGLLDLAQVLRLSGAGNLGIGQGDRRLIAVCVI
jgi:hypothetical protein